MPDLDELLRAEAPLRISGGHGRVFSCRLESRKDAWVGQQFKGRPVWAHDGLTLIAVVRDATVVPPSSVERFEVGDNLILAATEQAYAQFLRTRQQPSRSTAT